MSPSHVAVEYPPHECAASAGGRSSVVPVIDDPVLSLLADPSERAFQSAFYKNGLALVEINLGEPSEALRLVDECIASLDQSLAPDEHRLHRSVLKNNRARVYLSLGRLEEALADYAVVIQEDTVWEQPGTRKLCTLLSQASSPTEVLA